jgi:hypothetical protein
MTAGRVSDSKQVERQENVDEEKIKETNGFKKVCALDFLNKHF